MRDDEIQRGIAGWERLIERFSGEDLRRLFGRRVRVLDGQKSSVRAEGEVIGIIECPTLIIRCDDGSMAYEASSLPREVQEWREDK